MKIIYKYPIKITDYQVIEMPINSNILTVQMQKETPCIWAIVDPDNKPELRHIRIVGTGHPINNTMINYIGTFQMASGILVWHVFEIKILTKARLNLEEKCYDKNQVSDR